MATHYDALETRSAPERERALMAALMRQIAHAKAHTSAFAELLAHIEPASVSNRAALSALPVVRKHEDYMARQGSRRDGADAFGGFAAVGWNGLRATKGTRRVFQSPGPIYEPEGHGGDFERGARAMFAAGFRAGELVHNSFSYHLTPAGAMMESAASVLGCTVFPGGVGNTELQIRAIVDLAPTCYVGTPSFLRALIERSAQLGHAGLSFRKALVSGEAFPPEAKAWLHHHGVDAYQSYMTADVGLIAYETEARDGLVVDEGLIVEVVKPGTGSLVPNGEVGELVVTSLNPDYPLIRFGTGDLTCVLPGLCPTGRTNVRIKGWLGRADQTAKVRGMFVHPAQLAEIMGRHAEVTRLRLVITGGAVDGEWVPDEMTLMAESTDQSDALPQSLAASARDVTKLRASVQMVAPRSLPNDGKVIVDLRALPAGE